MRTARRWSILAAVVALPLIASAQIHHLDPLPFSAAADSASRRGVVLAFEAMPGTEPGWRAERARLLIKVPIGERGLAYLQGSYTRLEIDGLSLFERWPGLAPVPEAGEEDPRDDPFDADEGSLRNGFGPPELGVIFGLDLPALGPGLAAFQVSLPFGREVLYPLSSRALVLVLDWQREAIALGPLAVTARVGWEIALDASGDHFVPEAFPDGPRWGLDLGYPRTAPRGVSLGWSARELEADRHQRQAVLTGWWPLAERHRLWLGIVRDLGVRQHRLADWTLTVGFDFRGLLDPEN